MTTTKSYFTTATTLEELKQEYKRLAMLHHPDLGGNTETMKAINNEYDALFEELKHTHKNKAGEYYTKENTTETAGAWREVIEKLIRLHMENVKIEVIGSFLWISGNTKPYKEELKAIGMKWSKNKTAWWICGPEPEAVRARRDSRDVREPDHPQRKGRGRAKRPEKEGTGRNKPLILDRPSRAANSRHIMKGVLKVNIITKKVQGDFEREAQGTTDRTPEICGYYGRACRQMEKDEGANRALCIYCPLAEYGKKENAQ